MPAALERALKRKVAGKNWSEERKDAYVYGTLRKTGWKPSHQKEKKMSTEDRVVRLSQISGNLDKILQFQDDDDDDRKNKTLRNVAIGAGALGAGGAVGYGLAQRYPAIGQAASSTISGIKGATQTGYGLVKQGYEAAAPAVTSAAKTAYGAAKPVVKKGLGAAGDLLSKIAMKFEGSKIERLIQLNKALGDTIEFVSPELRDPGAGQFGGTDPGIAQQIEKDKKQYSALQRLRLRIASLRGMGLHS